MFQILTAVGQNPGLLENPVTKTLLFEYAEKIGVNPLKLEVAENQGQQNQVTQQQNSMNLPQALKGGGQGDVGRGATAQIGLGGRKVS